MEVDTHATSPALVTSLEKTSLDSGDQPSPSAKVDLNTEKSPASHPGESAEPPVLPEKSPEESKEHESNESPDAAPKSLEPADIPTLDERVSTPTDLPSESESNTAVDLHKKSEDCPPSDPPEGGFAPEEESQPSDAPLQLTNRPGDLPERMCSPDMLQREDREELDLSMPGNTEPQNLSQSPRMCSDDGPPRHLMDEQGNMLDSSDGFHQQQMQQHYAQQHCHMQYQQHLQKIASQNHLRDPHRLHDYDEAPPHPHLLGEQRHLPDAMTDHPHHPNDRAHDGYWNMSLGVISKVKSESKHWFDENEEMMADNMSGSMKSDPSSYYRSSPHSNMSGEMLAAPRPPSMPHEGIPFSQGDVRSQPQHWMNHHGMRDMSPMSPGYPSHQRTSQQSQHFNMQHGTNPIGAMPQHPPTHMPQQFPNQSQFNNQQPLGLPSHHQQIPSPYHQSMGLPGMAMEGREGRSDRDPYNFVDECTGAPPRPIEEVLGQQPKRRGRKPKHIKLMENGGDPAAIAVAQAAHEAKKRRWRQVGPDGKMLPLTPRPRKRIDRFDGMPEDELSKKTLPDHLTENLDIVIISKFPFQIGINPGLLAAYKGHHYAGPGNHFWKCLYLSGLIPEPLSSDDDSQLLEHGIGFTNIVSRTTKGSAELTRKEIKEGGQLLLAKLQRFQPRIAVFNGKGIYEIFSGKKDFSFGRQPEKIEGTHTHVWVMPSSSARCAQLPRALDKVPFYTALRKFRDFIKGTLTELTEEEVTFTTKARHIKSEIDKLDPSIMSETMQDPYLDEPTLTDPTEPEMDSDEISRSISQSLFKLAGISREQLETMDCATIPIRKKRGRPKKTPDDPNAPSRPKPRPHPTDLLMCNGEEPPRKKRGRPKKVLEDGSIPPAKRPGRKPKALKEVLASQPMGQNVHNPMSMGGLNGMMPPTGYTSTAGGPFSPHYGPGALHSMNGPSMPGMSPTGMSNHTGMSHTNTRGLPSLGNSMGAGPLPSMGSLHPPMCNTPNSSNGSMGLGQMPPRGNTPKPYGQSPGYSPGPGSVSHQQIGQPFSHPSDKSDMQSVDDHDLGLSPPPCGSPGMVQPDFEPPTSLPESESMVPNDLSTRGLSQQDEAQLNLIERQQHTPSMQSQFSNPATPAEETPYQGYQPYATGKPCSPSYNSSVPVAPSPSYSRTVSQSPSYPPSVSRSPSYSTNNTQSPCHTNLAHSPSYPPNSTNSPSSYNRNTTQSPSFPPSVSRSPSYPSASNHSPSFATTTTQSPSCSSMTRSPTYPPSLTHSPSYAPTSNHSPSSYRPPMSHSPSVPKPLIATQTAKGDVSSKSISGLESLVDQIPSLSEGESGPVHLSNPGPSLSNPVTPGPVNGAAPFSPTQPPGPYQSFPGGPATPYGSHYGSPQSAPHQYSPHYSSSSTNLGSTNFSVSSLANSSITTSLSYSSGYEGEATSNTTASNAPVTSNTNNFSVSSLTADSPAPAASVYNNGSSYSPLQISGSGHSYPDIMNPTILPPTPPMGPGFMGSSGLPTSMPGSMGGSIHPPMNMSGSQIPYPYSQYGDSAGGYSAPGHGFGYPPTGPGFLPHRLPYPYANYTQGYPQGSVLERIKQSGMGFGSY